MFQKDFVWGVASSAYQVEGTDPQDGRGKCIWDTFTEEGKTYEHQNAWTTCDQMHRYRKDYALMRNLGIHNYRFSISWSRLVPQGCGEVNRKAVTLYRQMLSCMIENGIKPYITLYHWELPQALQDKGGWLNRDIVEWFGEYARVAAENFSDLCDTFITINEPQCVINLGLQNGIHAPGLKLTVPETLLATHHLLMAHGMAVKMLRKYAKQPLQIGYAPTGGVAYPEKETPENIEAARKVYFGFYNELSNWAWNISWFSDPVFLGHYPQEGLQKFAAYLPTITREDMELIAQPIDFMGQNIYNGYPVRVNEKGEPAYTDRLPGFAKTASQWPVTPRAFYYGIRFLCERYGKPLYITENGMSCHDMVSTDGCVHDPNRISFLDAYLSQMQIAHDEGYDIRGYFLWTFLDNFEWNEGYTERFGIVHVNYQTQQRIVKDSAFWYQKTIACNGRNLMVNQTSRELLLLDPVCTHNIWGGTKLRDEFGYAVEGDKIGECWGISAHPNGDGTIRNGIYGGSKLSEVWEKHPELFGNLHYDRFPIMTKIIDAKNDLSIQVHPDDAYAKEHENGSFGKMESWYILDCGENATLVAGHNAKTKEELRDMIQQGRWKEFIREVPIHKGDFIQIDPGTVHAIKGGTLLLETQQNSDITYRVYDYDRLSDGKPRKLHIAQSMDVIRVPAAPVEDAVRSTAGLLPNRMNLLADCKYYKIFKLVVEQEMSFEQQYPFLILSVVNGDGMINSTPICKGDHLIVPSGYGKIILRGKMEMIASTANEV